MANNHITPQLNATYFLSDVATALTAKYSTALTIHYQTTDYLIFSCPAISSKVIKIYYTIGKVGFYYGDAWTSGSTITNQVTFCLQTYSTYNWTGAEVVLGDSFLLFNLVTATTSVSSKLAIIALDTNGDSVVFGMNGGTSVSALYENDLCRNITDAKAIMLRTFDDAFLGADNKVYKFPLIITDSSGVLLLDGEDEPLSITDLYVASYKTSDLSYVIGSNSLITTCHMHNENTSVRLGTGLIAEW